jgi:hypothetical protein
MLIVVTKIQAERRAEVIGHRPAATSAAGRGPRPAEGRVLGAGRRLVTAVLVTVGIAGLAGAGTLLAGPTPADGHRAGFAD